MDDFAIDPKQYEPGSYGCHEALHMASFLANAVSEELCEHNAIKANPEWEQLATTAFEALYKLYQEIGAKHLVLPEMT
jgi:hypothetical protein